MIDLERRGRSWSPSSSRDRLHARARLYATMRAFFAQRDVLEVETPILSHAAGTDPALAWLHAAVSGRTMYLQTSPEFAMKRLLASGVGDIFQLCKVFRDDEVGRQHQPEFTMLEWYRQHVDHHQLMDEVEALLQAVAGPLLRAERHTFRALVHDATGIDPHTADAASLCGVLEQRRVPIPAGMHDDAGALLDLVVGDVLGPTLGQSAPCFVFDYPANRAALARVRQDDPPVAERFELYWHGMELANGFHELTDAREQQRRFASEDAARERAGQSRAPIDTALLGALEAGMPDCAGVALGVDRLLMCLSGAHHIRDVVSFDHERA